MPPGRRPRPRTPRGGEFPILDQRGQFEVTGRHDPVPASAALQAYRLGQQRQPDPSPGAVQVGGADEEGQSEAEDPFVAVQGVERGEPVQSCATWTPVRFRQPDQRPTGPGDVEDPLGTGRGQVGERGEDGRRVHRPQILPYLVPPGTPVHLAAVHDRR